MDLYAAELVAPFPDSGDLLYATDIHSHRQKLRPIRSNASGDLPCVLNTDFSDPLLSPSFQPPDPIAFGSGHVALPSAQDSGFSLDDEDDDNSCANTKQLGSRKRRKKTEKNLEDFVRNMVTKVMEKQEQMHQQLVDMIESRERERIKREEAWKQEEMERIRKDEEARARDMSRNLALISLIQNLLGQEDQLPKPAETSSRKDDAEVEVNLDQENEVDLIDGKDFDNDSSISDNRWPSNEEQTLINLRATMDHKFRMTGYNGSVWEEISEAMHGMGYSRSSMQCKQKWEYMNRHYNWVKMMKKGQQIRKNENCAYVDDLDVVYRNGSISLGKALSNANNTPNNDEKKQSET